MRGAGELLQVERDPLALPDDPLTHVQLERRGSGDDRDEGLGVVLGERAQLEDPRVRGRQRVGHARRRGRRDDDQETRQRLGGEPGQGLHAGRVGVGDVVDRHDGRCPGGQPAQPLDQGVGGELGQPPRVHARRGQLGAACQAETRSQDRGGHVVHAQRALEMVAQAGGTDDRLVVRSDARGGREQDAHRPVRGAGIEPVRCTVQHRRTAFGGQGGERRREAGLADPAVADDCDDLTRTVPDVRPQFLQALDLPFPSNQRRLPPGRDPAGLPVHSHDLVGRHHHTVTQHGPGPRRHLDRALDQPEQGAADDHGPRAGRLLELGREVGGMPEGQRPALVLHRRDEHLTRVRRNADLKRFAGLAVESRRHAIQDAEKIQSRAHGPQRVVLVRLRVSEPDVDAVAMVLGDKSAMSRNDDPACVVIGAQDGVIGLDVSPAGHPCRIHHVTEHDDQVTAFVQ